MMEDTHEKNAERNDEQTMEDHARNEYLGVELQMILMALDGFG